MIYTDLTKKAMKLCYEVHRDQVDKGGLPYVFHPLHVAECMTQELSTAVALLHDVVEDSACTLRDLRAMGFPAELTDALALLTHDPAVPYSDYIAAIKANPVAAQQRALPAGSAGGSGFCQSEKISGGDRASGRHAVPGAGTRRGKGPRGRFFGEELQSH